MLCKNCHPERSIGFAKRSLYGVEGPLRSLLLSAFYPYAFTSPCNPSLIGGR